ncbi:MAG: hypothetical protein K2X82_20685, partial [Gemmataceae bacterium]|nr:hypothetical protein [Gemmataceae bacterium]
MAEGGDDTALTLLRALPAEAAEAILGRLPADAAGRLRDRLKDAPATPPAGAELDAALAQFFDLQRIAERPAPPPAAEGEEPAPDPIAEV